MSQQASSRGTFLQIADVVRGQIEAHNTLVELPSAPDQICCRARRTSRKANAPAKPVPMIGSTGVSTLVPRETKSLSTGS